MRPAQNVDKLIKQLQLKASPALDERVHTEISKALAARTKTGSARTWPNIAKNPALRLAAAAVVAIALLIGLSYGTADIIKRVIIGSVDVDHFKAKFELNRDIPVNLKVGTPQEPKIVFAGTVRFFREGEQILGTLRCRVRSWPRFKWRTKVELLNAEDKVLTATEHTRENGGAKPVGRPRRAGLAIHFSLGSSTDISQAENFKVTFEHARQETQTTQDAWVESSELEVVHGRVTGPGGTPISDARIPIREPRKLGQRGIATPDVHTNKDGYYNFDDIDWPYRVGAIVYEENPSGKGYRHQYMRFNEVLEGTQTVDFSFGAFPRGTATLAGKAVEANGKVIKEFTIDVRNNVDWKDYSTKYLYQYGLKKPFSTTDGTFEIAELPAGSYRVLILPTKNETVSVGEFMKIRKYLCELVENQTTHLREEEGVEKIWYGRVLFEDATAAVSQLPKIKTQVVKWEKGYPKGVSIAMADEDGYFSASISDEVMARLKSGQAWLTINISNVDISHEVEKERFPIELLSTDRNKAGVAKITRPTIYYGRILYENGKPAVPPIAPWEGATVWLVLRYVPATSSYGGVKEWLAEVDKQGYFAFYLADEQLDKIKADEYIIQVYHPSYEDERASFPVANLPAQMLATDQGTITGYKLAYEKMGPEFRNLKQQHESAEKLEKLGSAFFAYFAKHPGRYPESLVELKSRNVNGLSSWLSENVEYLAAGKIPGGAEGAPIVLAYDRALLKKAGCTNVLFYNGQVEFCRSKRLQTLGIEGQ